MTSSSQERSHLPNAQTVTTKPCRLDVRGLEVAPAFNDTDLLPLLP